MLLVVMIFLIGVSAYIVRTQNAEATLVATPRVKGLEGTSILPLLSPLKVRGATLGLYASFIALFWVVIEVALSTRSLHGTGAPLPPFLNGAEGTGGSPSTDSPYVSMASIGVLEKEGYTFFNTAYVSIDTVSAPFCLLTGIVFPIAILASEGKAHTIAPLLITEAILLGAFVTLDLITFYAMFEAVLIPMFIIIGRLGSEKGEYRKSAAYRLFLYTGGWLPYHVIRPSVPVQQ